MGTHKVLSKFFNIMLEVQSEKQMYMLPITKNSTPWQMNPQKDLLIQSGVGRQVHTINDKVILKIDTGADVNALNRKTFQMFNSGPPASY